jgi:hypothetical protein
MIATTTQSDGEAAGADLMRGEIQSSVAIALALLVDRTLVTLAVLEVPRFA